jgi:hypothetical protein
MPFYSSGCDVAASIWVCQSQRTGSNPVIRLRSPVAQLGERLSYKEEVAGSNPVGTTNYQNGKLWECNSKNRVPGFDPGSCRFESYHSCQFDFCLSIVGV